MVGNDADGRLSTDFECYHAWQPEIKPLRGKGQREYRTFYHREPG